MMKKKILGCLLIAFLTGPIVAQKPPELKPVRIADSLSAKELADRNPVLLRKELDSLIKAHQQVIPVDIKKEEASQPAAIPVNSLLAGAAVIILLLLVQLLLSYRQHKWLRTLSTTGAGNKLAVPEPGAVKAGKKTNTTEEKGENLQTMISRLTKENEGLQAIITEHNGISREYDQLSKLLQQSYKIKQYPGNDGSLQSAAALQAVMATEKAIAEQAYEKFLKPLLQLTDANKNQPAKMSAADKEKLIDLLLSLSFLYIEYLYLRVSELAVGGAIVERLKALSNGQELNEERLRKLNRESGSRALVLRLGLDHAGIQQLSYPVFEETNLNKG